MPKLTKIRITGNKYDGFKKEHNDSIFDLAPEGEGDHTLFTLQNGSGKGVMLQLISQILLPGTSWGPNNGNHLEAMFYNRYNVFKPYTFHVVLEWNLDQNPDKRLVAGICVSARRRESTDDSEGKVGLKYFLYTHEYNEESSFSLENLPLYNKTENRAAAYQDFEGFIDDNRQYFRKYTKTAVASLNAEYYQYLASHGIYRSEWEIMRTINRAEGGLDKYFSRAQDNQALFNKLIIPAVSESISHRSQENETSLLNMFIDNIKIAENLPELISRTEDIKQLTQMVEPLLIDAEHGIKLKNARKAIRNRGNNIYRGLKSRQITLQNELDRSQQELDKTNARIEELLYQKENLKYARKTEQLTGLQQKQVQLNKKKTVIVNNIEDLSASRKKLRLNQLYLPYQQDINESQQLKARISNLKQSLGLADLWQKIGRVKQKLKKSCPQLQQKWQETSLQVAGFQKHLLIEERQLQQRSQELNDQRKQLERKNDRFLEKKKNLEQWQHKLADRFNSLQLSTPAYLKEQLTGDLEQLQKKLNLLQQQLENKTEAIAKTTEQIHQLDIKLTKLKTSYQNTLEKYQERQTEEDKLFVKIVKLLDLDKYKEVYSKDWLAAKQLQLQQLLKEKGELLQQLKNKTYELKIDLSLNDDDQWIANHDQQRLYQVIANMDIQVYYGSDFLINVAEDKEDLIINYPLLPYGLVLMYENDWLQVKRNLRDKDIFRAPVPIFINFQLQEKKEQSDYFKLVHGEEMEFINHPDSFRDWYQQLENKCREIDDTAVVVGSKVNHIRRVNYTVEDLLQKKTSAELERELEEISEQKEKMKSEIADSEKTITRLQQEKQELTSSQQNKEKQQQRLKKDREEIKNFARETTALKQQEQEIKDIKEKLSELDQHISNNANDLHENNKLQMEIEIRNKNWQRDQQRFLSELQEIIPEIDFEGFIEKEVDPCAEPPRFCDYRESEANYYYQELVDLEQEEETKSAELKYLRKELKRLRQQITQQEEKLAAVDSDWQSYSPEEVNQEKLKVKLDRVNQELLAAEKEKTKVEKEINILTGKIETKRDEVEELFNEISDKFHKSAHNWTDLDLDQKELEINRDLKDSRNYQQKLTEMITAYEEKINQIKSLSHYPQFYQLDAEAGEINNRIKEQIRVNPEEIVEGWIQDYQEVETKLNNLKQKVDSDFSKFKRDVQEVVVNEILKGRIKDKIIEDFHSENYKYNYEMLTSFREYLHNELNRLDDDRMEAERARSQWAERSAMHVMRIITSLQEMVNNMVYHNQRGFSFPLVRLRRSDLLPENAEEIIAELKEYFVEVITEFKQKDIKVEKLTEGELKQYTGDAALFSRAVRGRYPVLQVYKMTEKNEFLYARPRDYYYADWEAVIQGKGETPEGSGGQSLSINAFMMMMLLNYKKQRLDQSNPWTVLLLDNPFGKASAAHVLDPVFEIADKLNFQIVAFAAPEIIKTEISERFPVFWALEIADDDKGHGVVNGQVMYGERIRTA